MLLSRIGATGGGGGGGGPAWADTMSDRGAAIADGGWQGYTMRFQIPTSILTTNGLTQMRFTVKAPPAVALSFDGLTFHPKGIGTYDFDATPVPILQAGSASWAVPANTAIVSDPISFVFDKTKIPVIAIASTNATAGAYFSNFALAGATAAYKFGNDTGPITATGYAQWSTGLIYGISRIEVI